MASNKNNRKKGKKRAQQHSAPAGFEGKKSQYKNNQPAKNEPFYVKHLTILKWVSLVVMLGGYFMAYSSGIRAGYLIACVGALLSSLLVGVDLKTTSRAMRLLPRICYAFFAAIMLYSWLTPIQ